MTTVPFTAQETLQYVNGHRPQTIDLSRTPLTPVQVWNYLAYLKVEDHVSNISHEQLAAYLTTRDFVKSRGVVNIVKQVLYWHCYREPYQDGMCDWDRTTIDSFVTGHRAVLNDLMVVLDSLPVFLKTKAGTYTPLEAQYGTAPISVGVNFCHLFEDDMFLMELLPHVFTKHVEFDVYYNDLFDSYMYGGDNLVWFVISNPNNIFFKAFVS